jgi:hypothetical protein
VREPLQQPPLVDAGLEVGDEPKTSFQVEPPPIPEARGPGGRGPRRDLEATFGEEYARYAAATPAFFPRLGGIVKPNREGR